jgi:hypothetical protein
MEKKQLMVAKIVGRMLSNRIPIFEDNGEHASLINSNRANRCLEVLEC